MLGLNVDSQLRSRIMTTLHMVEGDRERRRRAILLLGLRLMAVLNHGKKRRERGIERERERERKENRQLGAKRHIWPIYPFWIE